MIQSDTLSRRPDFVPDKDTDNEDIVMLPDNLFIQLLDIELQRRIANTNDLDEEVTKALMTMLEQGPTAIRRELGDWTIKKSEGRDIIFFKGKNFIPREDNLQRDITKISMIMKRQVILVNLKHIMPCNNTTGGLDCAHTLKIKYAAVDLVNNLKSIDHRLDLLTSLQKELNLCDPLQTAPWISLWTYQQWTVLTLSWSW